MEAGVSAHALLLGEAARIQPIFGPLCGVSVCALATTGCCVALGWPVGLRCARD